ncbi:MAG: helix-turn-helix domain-containing protein [Parvibaculum sp.]
MPDVGWSMHGIGKGQLNHGECGLKVSRVETRRLNDFERHAQVTIAQEIVARAFRISVTEIKAPTRRAAPVALARQTAMYLMHVVFGMSLSAVGRHFGRDRTTASHACRQIEDRRDDPAFDLLVDRLEFAVWSIAIREFGPGQNAGATGIHVGNSFARLSQ